MYILYIENYLFFLHPIYQQQVCLNVALHDGSQKSKVKMVRSMCPLRFCAAGRVVILDNYYATRSVANFLLHNSMHLLATVKSNMIPNTEKKVPWTLAKNSDRGKFIVYEEYNENGHPTKVKGISWMDSKVVNFITTLDVYRGEVVRKIVTKTIIGMCGATGSKMFFDWSQRIQH